MKPGPLIAMAALLFVGMWLVLQPTLARGHSEVSLRIGSEQISATRHRPAGQRGADDRLWEFTEPDELAARGPVTAAEFAHILGGRIEAWNGRPAWERHLLGFFNISEWSSFVWVAVGLGGQAAFFGRMLVQWVVSEKSGRSQVPELFWWLSFAGGLCLFAYFVWRVDMVGVLGQSTGLVIYARNLRLIHKEKRRDWGLSRRAGRVLQADPAPMPETAAEPAAPAMPPPARS